MYGDEKMMAAESAARVATAQAILTSSFEVCDLGEMEDFLGMRIDRDRAAMTLTVANLGHIAALLSSFGMRNAHVTKTPMAPVTAVTRKSSPILTADILYSELVGSLLYLATTTRRDIAYATGVLRRFMHNPEENHSRAMKYVLMYLAWTANMGLCFGSCGDLVAACDADYAGDVQTRRSTSRWCFIWNGTAVSWTSNLQPKVCVSTAEAECLAAAAVTKEALL